MKLPLTYYGNPILRQKSAPITAVTEAIREVVDNMIETMDAADGIGISAIQVGEPIRLFVLRRYIHQPSGQWSVSEPYIYINPKILDHSKETWENEEGCLSIPKIHLPVVRPLRIKVESMKLDGSSVVEELEGINARVILHENDHLNGVLFIDRVERKYLQSVEGKLRDIKKKYSK